MPMKIAYIMYPGACYIGVQAMEVRCKQKSGSKDLNKKVILLIESIHGEHYDWKNFDIIHVFGFGLWNYDMIHWGAGLNPNLYSHPSLIPILQCGNTN